MDNRTEVREFLATRRAKITPDQAGVPLYGQRRRVPGLRREEVAQLAGLSTDYYTRLEKGNLRGASDSVLEAIARYCFIDPNAEEFYPDWAEAADTTVAILRTEVGRDPYNRALTDLVGEPATRSDAFRTRWAAHDVRLHHAGIKRFHHPLVGDLSVGFNAPELPADLGLTLTVYTAEPGSDSAEKLALLASWVATSDREQPSSAAERA